MGNIGTKSRFLKLDRNNGLFELSLEFLRVWADAKRQFYVHAATKNQRKEASRRLLAQREAIQDWHFVLADRAFGRNPQSCWKKIGEGHQKSLGELHLGLGRNPQWPARMLGEHRTSQFLFFPVGAPFSILARVKSSAKV